MRAKPFPRSLSTEVFLRRVIAKRTIESHQLPALDTSPARVIASTSRLQSPCPMSRESSPGNRFRAALAHEQPLQIAGAINAYAALLAQRAGFHALYLSGAGVANHSYGIPDTGQTELADVLVDVRRIA